MEKHKINLEGAQNQFLDWTQTLKIIQNKSEKNVLEFGCGFGTQFLCNEFKNVYSFEISAKRDWYDKTVELLEPWNNWNGAFYTSKDIGTYDVVKSLYDGGKNRDYSVFYNPNGFYDKLNEFVDLSTIDVAFVDHSQYMRAETVISLLDLNIPIVFAHDTNYGNDVYGWYLIENREDYDKIKFSDGQGTTYWIKK